MKKVPILFGYISFFSYISTVIMRDMRNKLFYVLVIGSILFLSAVIIPLLIQGFFWVLLQMMYYPLTTLVILVNLMLWNYLYIRYTENKIKKSTK
jgi:hypothetical protein